MRAILVILLAIKFVFCIEILRLSEFKDQNVSGWLMSEKFDGVRAYWDGRNLLSRNGKILNAPSEFTAYLPPFELDGELFSNRGEFEKIQSVVMDKTPDVNAWKEIKFYVFDVPGAQGGLLKRLEKLENFLLKNPAYQLRIKVIKQIIIKDNAEPDAFLNDVIKRGGEGVVVREPNVPYERNRSQNALKLKKFHDAECETIAINNGNGKYKNLMGSVTCKDLKSGKIFKIGSGFSDAVRANPPKIGEIITYKFQNLTANGLPRFPVFLRIRKD
ncbi:MAG: DNA ligase [Campylobacter sp.]|nr:DNA ligase [Campylobacter sp.]